MFRKITAEVTAVGLALTVLASAAQAEVTELTDAQMDQITAGVFQVVVGSAGNLLDSSGNLYVRQAAPTQYVVGTVLWSGNLKYFDGTAPGLPAIAPYASGTLTGPGGQTNTGGFVVPTGYPT